MVPVLGEGYLIRVYIPMLGGSGPGIAV